MKQKNETDIHTRIYHRLILSHTHTFGRLNKHMHTLFLAEPENKKTPRIKRQKTPKIDI